MYYQCTSCQKILHNPPVPVWLCGCGKPLSVHYEWEGVPRDIRIKQEEESLWRYNSVLPSNSKKEKISLGEGWTPLLSIGNNVYVKIPVVNSKGKFTGRAIKELSSNNVKLNITAVYTYDQVKKIVKVLNKRSKSIISIFAGRMADVGKDPVPIFKRSINLTKKYKNIEILWASTREVYNFLQAKDLGCQIITTPPKIIEKINNFGTSYHNLTLDTVKGFLKDSRKSKFRI